MPFVNNRFYFIKIRFKNSKGKDMQNILFKTAALSFALSCALSASQAQDAAKLSTVTVEANKIQEDPKDIPQSISVVGYDEIERKNIKDLSSALKGVPGFSITDGIHETISVRGLNQSMFSSNNPVAVYINGGGGQSNRYGYFMPLTNVERIEILRGPSSAIYGKDSIGGVINVITKEPTNTWSGTAGLEYATYNFMQASLEAGGALIQDKLFLSINGLYSKDDGWITNDLTGKKANAKNARTFGASLKAKPLEDLSIKIFANSALKKNDFTNNKLTKHADFKALKRNDIKHTNLDLLSNERHFAQTVGLDIRHETSAVNFTSSTSYKKAGTKGDYDMDFGNTKDFAYYAGLMMFGDVEVKTLAQEFRATSTRSSALKWIGGIYLEEEKTDIKKMGQQFPANPPSMPTAMEFNAPAKANAKTASVFAQGTAEIASGLDLTLAGRFQHIKKDINVRAFMYPLGASASAPFNVFKADKSWDVFLPKLGLTYAISNEINTYAMYSKGYMAGGFNFYAQNNDKTKNTFKPQTTDNYELGLKGAFDKARFSAAVFYMNIKDTHIYFVDPANPNNYSTGNAGKSISKGLEAEGVFKATSELDLKLAANFTSAKYKSNYLNRDGSNNKGNKIERTPAYKISAGASYTSALGFYAGLDLNAVGKTYFDEKNQYTQGAYATADLRFGYTNGEFDLYAYGKNITDKDYITNVMDRTDGLLVSFNEGRILGFGAKYNF